MKLHLKLLLLLFIFSYADSIAQKLTNFKGDYKEGYGEFSYYGTWDEKVFHGKYLYIEKKTQPTKQLHIYKGEYDNGIKTGKWIHEDINYGMSFTFQYGFNYYSVDGSKDISYKIVTTHEYKKGILDGLSSYRWIDYDHKNGKSDTTTTKFISVKYKNDRPVGKFSFSNKLRVFGYTNYLFGELNDSSELDGKFHLEFTNENTLYNDPQCPNGRYIDDREYRDGILRKAKVWNKNVDRVIYEFKLDTSILNTDSNQFDILLEKYDKLKNHFYTTDNYSSIEEKVNDIEDWTLMEIPTFLPFEINAYHPKVNNFKRSTFKKIIDNETLSYYKILKTNKTKQRLEFNAEYFISLLNGNVNPDLIVNILIKKSDERFRNITLNTEQKIDSINRYFGSLTRLVAFDTNYVQSVASHVRKANLSIRKLIHLQTEFDSVFLSYQENMISNVNEFNEEKAFSISPIIVNKMYTQIKENGIMSNKYFQSAFTTIELDSLIKIISQHDEKRNMMLKNARFLIGFITDKQTVVHRLKGNDYCHSNISANLMKNLEDDYRNLANIPFYLYLTIDTNVYDFFSASVKNMILLKDVETGIQQYNLLYYNSPNDCALIKKSGFLSNNNKLGINKTLIKKIEKYIFEDLVIAEKENHLQTDIKLLNSTNLALQALIRKVDYEEENKKAIKSIEDREGLLLFLQSLKP